MLEKVKQALRVDGKDFDAELNDMIEEAKAEMQRLALTDSALDKPLARRAIITYCRAHFDSGSDESFKLLDSFRLMVDEMRSSSEYTMNAGDNP